MRKFTLFTLLLLIIACAVFVFGPQHFWGVRTEKSESGDVAMLWMPKNQAKRFIKLYAEEAKINPLLSVLGINKKNNLKRFYDLLSITLPSVSGQWHKLEEEGYLCTFRFMDERELWGGRYGLIFEKASQIPQKNK